MHTALAGLAKSHGNVSKGHISIIDFAGGAA